MRDISVILPTRNRAAFIERCLASLCEQTLDPSRYEICVVNNGSTDNTAEIVAAFAAAHPRHEIFLVDEPQAGLSRARNRGLEATEAPLVANIDDDATAIPEWLERFAALYEKSGEDIAVAGGEVIPVWPDKRPDWITDWMMVPLSASTGLGKTARVLKDGEFLFEGNSCYRRAALEKAGRYPATMGRSGNNLLSGDGIVEVQIRLQGGRIYFDPEIVIHHTIHADRVQPVWFRRRYFWQGVTGFAQRRYYQNMGLRMPQQMQVNLPLAASDWAFINKDTPENIEQSMRKFESLGLVLALTGILPIEAN